MEINDIFKQETINRLSKTLRQAVFWLRCDYTSDWRNDNGYTAVYFFYT